MSRFLGASPNLRAVANNKTTAEVFWSKHQIHNKPTETCAVPVLCFLVIKGVGQIIAELLKPLPNPAEHSRRDISSFFFIFVSRR